MRILFSFIFSIVLVVTAKADITYLLTWEGSGGGSATAVMVIDETVCLDSGMCGCGSANQLGISVFDMTINGTCASTWDINDFIDFLIDQRPPFRTSESYKEFTSQLKVSGGGSGPIPDLTMDLLPQIDDFNIFSFGNAPDGYEENIFSLVGCQELFTLRSMIPQRPIPTMGQWGVIILGLLILIVTVVSFSMIQIKI